MTKKRRIHWLLLFCAVLVTGFFQVRDSSLDSIPLAPEASILSVSSAPSLFSGDIIATRRDGEVTPALSETDLATLARKILKNKYRALTPDATPSMVDAVELEDVKIDAETKYPHLLIYGRQPSGNCLNVAIALEETEIDSNGSIGFFLFLETDTCTGEPCTHCSFDRDETGKIIGCNPCTSPPPPTGICNHSVSE